MEKLLEDGKKIRCYRMTHATGFAPNPYGGVLTLATCKPKIRKVSQPGDWLVGIGSKFMAYAYRKRLQNENRAWEYITDDFFDRRVLYIMKVKEVIPWTKYYTDSRFKNKIPCSTNPTCESSYGDNIYEYNGPEPFDGKFPAVSDFTNFKYLENINHQHGNESVHDLAGENVLVGDPEYSFFLGKKAFLLPQGFMEYAKVGRSSYGRLYAGNGGVSPEKFLEYLVQKCKKVLKEDIQTSATIEPLRTIPEDAELPKKCVPREITTDMIQKQIQREAAGRNSSRKVKEHERNTIVFSRKGFDSHFGRMSSPIIGNKMLSLPIPADPDDVTEETGYRYSDLKFQNMPDGGETDYKEVIERLAGSRKRQCKDGFFIYQNGDEKYFISQDPFCHFDPQLFDPRPTVDGVEFEASLGQCASAQSELLNQGIRAGDLFLFFGNFQKARYVDGRLQFVPLENSAWKGGFHCLWGYLQIGEMITSSASLSGHDFIKKYHPHADWWDENDCKNNTIYVAAKELDSKWYEGDPALAGRKLPGYGIFSFTEDLILTDVDYREDGKQRMTVWNFDKDMKIAHKSGKPSGTKLRIGDIGQEIAVDADDEKSLGWAKEKFLKALRTTYAEL